MGIQIIYHGNCFDGFGAAYAAWKHFGDKATYHSQVHGASLPEIEEGSMVYFLDYCPKKEPLEDVLKKALDVVVLDHHQTAMDEQGVPRGTRKAQFHPSRSCHFVFDLDHSGASLAWKHFHGEMFPALISYIEDRDLWRNALPKTREIDAVIKSHPMDFDVWEDLEFRMHSGKEKLIAEGEAILRFQTREVEMICSQQEQISLLGDIVPAVNATSCWSEIGDELLRKNPEAPFACSYFNRGDGMQQWSLRSRPNDFDVSALAGRFGGGGHRAAAGFQIPMNSAFPQSHVWGIFRV